MEIITGRAPIMNLKCTSDDPTISHHFGSLAGTTVEQPGRGRTAKGQEAVKKAIGDAPGGTEHPLLSAIPVRRVKITEHP